MTDDRDGVCTEEEQAWEKAYQHELKSLKPGLLIPRRANSLKELPLERSILPIKGEDKGRYIHPTFQAKTAKNRRQREGQEKKGACAVAECAKCAMGIVRIAYLLKKRIFATVKPFTPPLRKANKGYNRPRRDGRVVDCGGLENR